MTPIGISLLLLADSYTSKIKIGRCLMRGDIKNRTNNEQPRVHESQPTADKGQRPPIEHNRAQVEGHEREHD